MPETPVHDEPFTHDCERCSFLHSTYGWSGSTVQRWYDLYACVKDDGIIEILARYGDDGGDYLCQTVWRNEREPEWLKWMPADYPCTLAWLEYKATLLPACTSTTPEPHQRGEFPMSCYACHMYADA